MNSTERVSDEDDESCSLEDSLRSGFGNLTVNDNDKNANKGAQGKQYIFSKVIKFY